MAEKEKRRRIFSEILQKTHDRVDDIKAQAEELSLILFNPRPLFDKAEENGGVYSMLGGRVMILDRADLTKHALQAKNDEGEAFFDKGSFGDLSKIFFRNGMITASEKREKGKAKSEWRRKRDYTEPHFDVENIDEWYMHTFEVVAEQVQRLSSEGATTVRLDQIAQEISSKVLSRAVFAEEVDQQLLDKINTCIQLLVPASLLNKIFFILKPLRFLPEKKRLHLLRELGKLAHQFTVANNAVGRDVSALIEARICSGQRMDDYLDTLIDEEESGKNTRQESVGDAVTMFGAGQETTRTIITYLLAVTAADPEITFQIDEEIERVVGDGPLTTEKYKQLEYIPLVVMEALRRYFAINHTLRECKEEHDFVGAHFRKGALVLVGLGAVHMIESAPEEVGWHDAQEFNPERHRSDHEQMVRLRHYAPFGGGPRQCIAANQATAEATAALIAWRQATRTKFPNGVISPNSPASPMTQVSEEYPVPVNITMAPPPFEVEVEWNHAIIEKWMN